MRLLLYGGCVAVVAWFSNPVCAGDIKGKVNAVGAKNNANAVIYIEKIPGRIFDPPKEPGVMDQKNFVYIPHVLPILRGTTVEFWNNDNVLHNVYGVLQKKILFNWAMPFKGMKLKRKFEEVGQVMLLCNVHPEMKAWIVVLENPYFAVSDKEGNYVIKAVPPGKHSLKIWHEKLQGPPQEVTVPETKEVTIDFEINSHTEGKELR